MKILIVDDCRSTRKLLGLYLTSNGYEVSFAENGIEAMEKLAVEDVNLIVTDLNMPYMDGIELLKTLKSDPARSYLPVLVVTTEKEPEERERALAAGASGFLVKPVSADAVTKNILQILRGMFKKGGNTYA